MIRKLLALRMLLFAWDEALLPELLARDTLIELACQYGASANLRPEEVEAVLCKSVQCIVLRKEEWS